MAQLGRTESLWHTAFGGLMKNGILELGYGQTEEKKVGGISVRRWIVCTLSFDMHENT